MSEPVPEQPEQEEQKGLRFIPVNIPPGFFRPKCSEGKHKLPPIPPVWHRSSNISKREMLRTRRCEDCRRTPKEIKKQRRQLFWKRVRKLFTR